MVFVVGDLLEGLVVLDLVSVGNLGGFEDAGSMVRLTDGAMLLEGAGSGYGGGTKDDRW